jgi:4-hydroxy-tetrahydrodipicolinate reductase
MTRVAVIGAKGRMGSEACKAIEADPDLSLSAGLTREDDLSALLEAGTEVAVELSTPSSVEANTRFCLENGVHVVVGATGMKTETIDELGAAAERSDLGLLVVPNFALGAVLMMRFASLAAPYFSWAEIVERHHEKKLDAPSGTALRTAAMMDLAPREGEGEIPIHSLRLPGSVAHQEVLLGAPGETLSIKHDSIDRISFMPGLLLAAKKVASLRGAVVGLENVLDI